MYLPIIIFITYEYITVSKAFARIRSILCYYFINKEPISIQKSRMMNLTMLCKLKLV